MKKFELIRLQSGIHTIKVNEYQETFHPGIGPMAEAEIIYVREQKLRERAPAHNPFVIWDVGLGAAANAIAAIEALKDLPVAVQLQSFDKTLEPLAFALEHAEELGYVASYRKPLQELIERGSTRIGPVEWRFHAGDFREAMQDRSIPAPDSVLYDPFSSATNQELWTLEHFQALRARLGDEKGYLLTNYTSSSAMRVTLLMAGYYVGVGAGVGKKKETTVASNRLEWIDRPLTREWLEKRKASQSSAPLRRDDATPKTIVDEDFRLLSRHPQFV